MNKKIILFASSNLGFIKSASILRLANELRNDGFDVTQIHHFLTFSYHELDIILQKFVASGGDIVCISTSFLSGNHDLNENVTGWGINREGVDVYKHLIFLCATAKKYKCRVIVGGWEITEDKFLRHSNWNFESLKTVVDYFVLGNGSSIIKKVALEQKINILSNKLVSSDPITDYSNISSSPLPQDHIHIGEALSFEIAAGCVFSCHFCGYSALGKKKTEYMRRYESLRDEIKSNYENFGTLVYDITDNIINDYHEKINWLIRIREETDIPFRWCGYVRLDTIKNKEQADQLRDSGMAGALMGIESFTASTGRYIGKMTDGDRLKDILRMCRESWKDNVIISASMIAGLPTETEEQITETYNWLNTEEGKHLIDTCKFQLLHISLGNDTKNDINKNRNHPFKDYKVVGNRWISPWSNSDRISKMVNEMNKDKINRNGIHSQSLTKIVNLGYDLEDVILSVRRNEKIRNKQKSTDFAKRVEYKDWIMSDLESMFPTK
jgi:radical SAM superfamily enzyme YgiQ (UPF0313 family)